RGVAPPAPPGGAAELLRHSALPSSQGCTGLARVDRWCSFTRPERNQARWLRDMMLKHMTMTIRSVGALMLALLLPASGATAAEIKVLSTGNMQTILKELTADFERTSGHKLTIDYGSTP